MKRERSCRNCFTEGESLRAASLKERQAFGQRVFGDDEFFERVLTETNNFTKGNLRVGGKQMAFAPLAGRVCSS